VRATIKTKAGEIYNIQLGFAKQLKFGGYVLCKEKSKKFNFMDKGEFEYVLSRDLYFVDKELVTDIFAFEESEFNPNPNAKYLTKVTLKEDANVYYKKLKTGEIAYIQDPDLLFHSQGGVFIQDSDWFESVYDKGLPDDHPKLYIKRNEE
jgi:hypothetical protein